MPRFITGVRLQIVCPCGTSPLYDATNRIIMALLEEPEIRRWGGITYSSVLHPVFSGQFWNNGKWEEDQNAVVLVDVPHGTTSGILPYLTRLRNRIDQVYEDVGQPQQALWITAQSVRILSD
jgi:hypothetical protein